MKFASPLAAFILATPLSRPNSIVVVWPVAYLGFHFGGGGGQNVFVKVGVFAWLEAPCSVWRSHAFVRGVRGHAPPRKFLKVVQFGAFGRIVC